jgi:hypothetical protein
MLYDKRDDDAYPWPAPTLAFRPSSRFLVRLN